MGFVVATAATIEVQTRESSIEWTERSSKVPAIGLGVAALASLVHLSAMNTVVCFASVLIGVVSWQVDVDRIMQSISGDFFGGAAPEEAYSSLEVGAALEAGSTRRQGGVNTVQNALFDRFYELRDAWGSAVESALDQAVPRAPKKPKDYWEAFDARLPLEKIRQRLRGD